MTDTESIFLKACRGERVERTPVWFMRQAGRSLPGYRELRKKYDVLTLAKTPELAAQISLEPVERLGVDAAILFADIMLLPIAMGIEVEIVESIGPVIDNPLKTPEGVSRLRVFSPKQADYLTDTIRILRGKLHVPLIGFAGAPFTLASYLIEGKSTRTWLETKHFMLHEPEAWHELMTKLSDGVIGYLSMQIEAGAQAVQLFDSWVGCLSPALYQEYVLPYTERIFSALKNKKVPRLHFGTNTAGFIEEFSYVDCEVIGVDWRIRLGDAKRRVGGKALQGNLDPALLLVSWTVLQKMIDAMFQEIDSKKGYIFNLGHGVLPETDDAVLKKLVEYVHAK